jgi:hypothetical protein
MFDELKRRLPTRRRFLLQLLLLGTLPRFGVAADSESLEAPPRLRPDRELFQSGDLVFPKQAGKLVLFDRAVGSQEEEMRLWETKRAEYLEQLSRFPNDRYKSTLRDKLQNMTYEEFEAIYLGEIDNTGISQYSLGPFSVGHVGIIEVTSTGEPFVIEAMPSQRWSKGANSHTSYPKGGVDRVSYQEWLDNRVGEYVWLARIRGYTPTQRQSVAQVASTMIGKEYNVFNLKLDDDREFYCSKLVWFSVMKAINISIDGDNDPNRYTPLSPKKILYAESLERLSDPGKYWKR